LVIGHAVTAKYKHERLVRDLCLKSWCEFAIIEPFDMALNLFELLQICFMNFLSGGDINIAAISISNTVDTTGCIALTVCVKISRRKKPSIKAHHSLPPTCLATIRKLYLTTDLLNDLED
jgi:hypothetical protein